MPGPSDEPQHYRGFSIRKRAMSRACPTCGAVPRGRCVGVRGKPRASLHADRIALARGERPA